MLHIKFHVLKNHYVQIFLSFLFLPLIITSSAFCGQVITDEARLWAKKALAQEHTIQQTDGKKTIAVLYFKNKTGMAELNPLQKGLAFMLITDLSTVRDLHVVERVKMQALMEEMGLGQSGLVESDKTPQTGRLLGAKWIVGGDILSLAQVPLYIHSSLLDVPDAHVLGQPTAEGILDNFFEIEKTLLFNIIDLLKVELTQEERIRLERPLSLNTKALLDLFKAIDASDQGNYEQAEQHYKNAIKKDAQLSTAEAGLRELQSLGVASTRTNESVQLLQTIRADTSLTDSVVPGLTTKRTQIPEGNRIPITLDVPVPPLGTSTLN
jgi:TolB-like protein